MFCFIGLYKQKTYEHTNGFCSRGNIMGRTNKKGPGNPQKTEILKETIDRITKTRTFNPPINSQTGNRIVRLKTIGESVIGFLGWPITNFREGTSYPLQLESGEIIEVIGNALLHKQIKQGDLCGQKVEIVYQGRDYIHGFRGHYRKVYRVYKYENKPCSKDAWNKIMADSKKTTQ